MSGRALGAIAVLALAGALTVGCEGGVEREPGADLAGLPRDPPRVAVAAVVNRMLDAFAAGDGETACGL